MVALPSQLEVIDFELGPGWSSILVGSRRFLAVARRAWSLISLNRLFIIGFDTGAKAGRAGGRVTCS